MVQINFAQRTVNVKIVYYGPGMSGKTTNLEVVHQRAPEPNRGELTSISTDGDRTLFFDFMPLDLGTVAGMRTLFQLYTVPGQVYYNSTRKLVLQGVDGVIFIADSSASMMEENLESLKNLQENLQEYGKDLNSLPWVIQYNKRDLPDALPVADLERALNPAGVPSFEGVANTGQGVFPTLKSLAARVLETIHSSSGTPGAGPTSQIGEAHPAGSGPMGGAQPTGNAPVTSAGTGFYPQPAIPHGQDEHAPARHPAHHALATGSAPGHAPHAGSVPTGMQAAEMGALGGMGSAGSAGSMPHPSFPQPAGNLAALPHSPHTARGAQFPAETAQSLEGTSLRLRPQGSAPAPKPGKGSTASQAGPRPRAQAAARPQANASANTNAQRAPGPAPRIKPRAAQATPRRSAGRTLIVAGLFVGLTLLAGVLVGKFVFNAF